MPKYDFQTPPLTNLFQLKNLHPYMKCKCVTCVRDGSDRSKGEKRYGTEDLSLKNFLPKIESSHILL